MRKLKFRLYLKDDKKYAGPYEPEEWGYMMEAHDLSNDNYVLEQYTGIEDINGVEIYEGDVLIIGKLKGVVSYDGRGMLGFETETTIYHIGHFNINNYEVIGNIHEE